MVRTLKMGPQADKKTMKPRGDKNIEKWDLKSFGL